MREIVAIMFGALAFIWPDIALVSLVLLYGVFAIVDGLRVLTAGMSGLVPRTLPTSAMGRGCVKTSENGSNQD